MTDSYYQMRILICECICKKSNFANGNMVMHAFVWCSVPLMKKRDSVYCFYKLPII